jgi:23S rRNA (adenine2503-C2)-methyltransferase
VLLAAGFFGRRPSHVLFMGVGEPLDNYDEVLKAVRIINHPDGLAVGARKITLSTSGLIPGIRRLAGEGLQVELSVSLHAPDDATRARLMPVNRKYPLADLIETCAEYTRQTQRIITFEYTLIGGVNDRPEQAQELLRLLQRLPSCRVNLIPLSVVEEYTGTPPAPEAVRAFQQALNRAGINTTLRDSRGSDLKAACGQLRSQRQTGS